MSDELFKSLRDRIQAFFEAGAAEAVLAPEALGDAAELLLSAGERSYAALSMLHWIRCQQLPEEQRGADHHAAFTLFTVLNTDHPDLVPAPVRQAFAEQPPEVQPAHEILHAVGAALLAELGRARAHNANDLLDRAIALFERAVGAAPREAPGRAVMELNLGSALSARFDLTGDLADLSTAIGAMRRAADGIAEAHPGRGQMWFALGNALARRFNALHDPADLEACEAALTQAAAGYPGSLELAQNLEAVRRARAQVAASSGPAGGGGGGSALSSRGLAHQEAGRLEEAAACYQEALPLLQAEGDRVNEGRTRNNLGTTYRLLGRLRDAAEQHEAAVEILREVGDALSTGRTLSNLGVAYRLLGRPQASLISLDEALKILRSCGDLQCEGTTLMNLGATYASMGRGEEAVQRFEEAAAVFERIGSQAGRAQALEMQARVLDALDRPEEAARCRRKAAGE